MVPRLSGTCRHARRYSPSSTSRPRRKHAANGTANGPTAPVAAAAHPAMAAVPTSCATRKARSSVSNRFAYSVVLTQANHIAANRPAKVTAPDQVRFLRNALASSATTST